MLPPNSFLWFLPFSTMQFHPSTHTLSPEEVFICMPARLWKHLHSCDHWVCCHIWEGRKSWRTWPYVQSRKSISSFEQIKKKWKGGWKENRRKEGNKETGRKEGEDSESSHSVLIHTLQNHGETPWLFVWIKKSRVYITVVIKTSQSDAIERLVVTLC